MGELSGGKGKKHEKEERERIVILISEAIRMGAGKKACCELIGISIKTIQRWEKEPFKVDSRKGPCLVHNKLSETEREHILETINSAKFRDLSPNKIVPLLADENIYLASESTIYKILKDKGQLLHRRKESRKKNSRPKELKATGVNQIWSWDITYLYSPIRGIYYYLYLVMDIYSRKIIAWAIHETQSSEHAAELIESACIRLKIQKNQLIIHSDNGGPMKGATLLSTLQKLEVTPSFSRPRVSDDNAYSESLFKTLKYRPTYPGQCFHSLDSATLWIGEFVEWYNNKHLHSKIGYVTPSSRYSGEDKSILENRSKIYKSARNKHPERWSKGTRNWGYDEVIYLNKRKIIDKKLAA